jgi:membrane protein
VSFVGIVGLIALVLKYAPDIHIRWHDVSEGAVATAVLFTIGKALIGVYLGRAAVGSAYGTAGSLVVVIVWVYYSAMIFYFGAEFTRARALAAGHLTQNARSRSGERQMQTSRS